MEKRSTSEKIMPKASMRKLHAAPLAMLAHGNTKENNTMGEQASPCIMTLKGERMLSQTRAALPLIADYENKSGQGRHQPLLKKTASAFQLTNMNSASAQKPLITHAFLNPGQLQRGSANVRSPKNDKFRERLTHANHVLSTVKAMPEFKYST